MSLIIIFFFLQGLGDNTISSFNIGIWTVILAVVVAVMCGSLFLKMHQHASLAIVLLIVIAIPALLFVLYFAIALIGGGRWN